jgi:predicted N-acyltransferase
MPNLPIQIGQKGGIAPPIDLMAESDLVHSKNESFYWQSRKFRNFANFQTFLRKYGDSHRGLINLAATLN